MNVLVQSLGKLLSACAAVVLLTHCGGVGQDGSGAVPPDTYTTGVVNGFGSVVVNGTHFDVRRAEIAMDGTRGRLETDLRVGMVVEVTGTVAADGLSGTATKVTYESALRGRLEAVSPSTQTLQLLGQQVTVDDTTLFSGADSLADLALNDQLQISGLRLANGGLRATFVAREASSGDRHLVAFITSVTGTTVQLAGLNIDISTAELVGVTLGSLATGQQVRVDLQAAPIGNTAVATRLRLIDTRSGDSFAKQQRQGFVTAWDVANSRFTLNGQLVQISNTTQYQDGNAGNIGNGVRVEVTGLRDTNGTLNATKLRFLRSSLSAYGRGRVTAVDAANQRFRVLDVPGVEIRIRTGTLLNDNTGGVLNLNNLTVGQEVVVLGVANGDRIEAEVVTRLANNPVGSGLAGPAQSITASGFTLLGVPVTTGGATQFFDDQGNPLSATTFFSTLQQDDAIRAEGVYAAGTLAAVNVRRVR